MSKYEPDLSIFSHSWRKVTVMMSALLVMVTAATAQHMEPTPALNAYFKMLYAGDLSGAASMLAENAQDPMGPTLAANFEARFINRGAGLDLSSIESDKARSILTLYQDYWRDALLKIKPLAKLDVALFATLDELLAAEGFSSAGDDEDVLQANVEAFLEAEGIYSQAGRTPPLQDLIVWTNNKVSTESIELTNGVFDVDVNYLDDFVSNGWMNFASFGMTRAGGWSEADAIYCVCSSYDMTSERFLVSFLKHEARHHLDLALYPQLAAPDMEYRGKLTELAFADEEIYNLMAQFTANANKIENAPHPIANWYVVDGFSRLLRDNVHPSSPVDWKLISKDAIRKAARQLLDEHDNKLHTEGAKTTRGVLTA